MDPTLLQKLLTDAFSNIVQYTAAQLQHVAAQASAPSTVATTSAAAQNPCYQLLGDSFGARPATGSWRDAQLQLQLQQLQFQDSSYVVSSLPAQQNPVALTADVAAAAAALPATRLLPQQVSPQPKVAFKADPAEAAGRSGGRSFAGNGSAQVSEQLLRTQAIEDEQLLETQQLDAGQAGSSGTASVSNASPGHRDHSRDLSCVDGLQAVQTAAGAPPPANKHDAEATEEEGQNAEAEEVEAEEADAAESSESDAEDDQTLQTVVAGQGDTVVGMMRVKYPGSPRGVRTLAVYINDGLSLAATEDGQLTSNADIPLQLMGSKVSIAGFLQSNTCVALQFLERMRHSCWASAAAGDDADDDDADIHYPLPGMAAAAAAADEGGEEEDGLEEVARVRMLVEEDVARLRQDWQQRELAGLQQKAADIWQALHQQEDCAAHWQQVVWEFEERLEKGIEKMAVAHSDNIGYYRAHRSSIIRSLQEWVEVLEGAKYMLTLALKSCPPHPSPAAVASDAEDKLAGRAGGAWPGATSAAISGPDNAGGKPSLNGGAANVAADEQEEEEKEEEEAVGVFTAEGFSAGQQQPAGAEEAGQGQEGPGAAAMGSMVADVLMETQAYGDLTLVHLAAVPPLKDMEAGQHDAAADGDDLDALQGQEVEEPGLTPPGVDASQQLEPPGQENELLAAAAYCYPNFILKGSSQHQHALLLQQPCEVMRWKTGGGLVTWRSGSSRLQRKQQQPRWHAWEPAQKVLSADLAQEALRLLLHKGPIQSLLEYRSRSRDSSGDGGGRSSSKMWSPAVVLYSCFRRPDLSTNFKQRLTAEALSQRGSGLDSSADAVNGNRLKVTVTGLGKRRRTAAAGAGDGGAADEEDELVEKLQQSQQQQQQLSQRDAEEEAAANNISEAQKAALEQRQQRHRQMLEQQDHYAAAAAAAGSVGMAAGSSGGGVTSSDGIMLQPGLRLLYEDAPAGPLNPSLPRCWFQSGLPDQEQILKPHQIKGLQFMWGSLVMEHSRAAAALAANERGNRQSNHRRGRQNLPTGADGAAGGVEDGDGHDSDFEEPDAGGCILAHSMGLGKSFQTVALLFLVFQKMPGRALLVVPTNVVRNWQDEFMKWLPGDKDADSQGSRLTKKKVLAAVKGNELHEMAARWLAADGMVLVLSYDLFIRAVKDEQEEAAAKAAKKGRGRKKSRGSPAQPEAGGPPEGAAADAVGGGHLAQLQARGMSPEAQRKAITRQALLTGATIIVADEAHVMKNAETAKCRLMRQLSSRRRLALTGYPLQNNLEEYYQMIMWVQEYFMDHGEFSRKFIDPIQAGQQSGSSAWERKKMARQLSVLHDHTSAFIQRAGPEILVRDLPPKREVVLGLKPTEVQVKLLQSLLELLPNRNIFRDKELMRKILDTRDCGFIWVSKVLARQGTASRASGPLSKQQGQPNHAARGKKKLEQLNLPAEVLEALIQLYPQHPRFTELLQERRERHPLEDAFVAAGAAAAAACEDVPLLPKELFVKQLVQSCCVELKEKVVIFTQVGAGKGSQEALVGADASLGVLAALERMLQKQFNFVLNQHFLRMDGGCSPSARSLMITQFNRQTACKVFLISTKAGSVGINLVAARRLVLYDLPWNPVHNKQAVSRIWRYGQRRSCFLYHLLYSGTVEERLYDRTLAKEELFARVVEKQSVKALLQNSDKELYYVDQRPPLGIQQLQELADNVLEPLPPGAEADQALRHMLKQTSTVDDLQLVELKNHEEQLQQDPAAKLTKAEKRQAAIEFELERRHKQRLDDLHRHSSATLYSQSSDPTAAAALAATGGGHASGAGPAGAAAAAAEALRRKHRVQERRRLSRLAREYGEDVDVFERALQDAEKEAEKEADKEAERQAARLAEWQAEEQRKLERLYLHAAPMDKEEEAAGAAAEQLLGPSTAADDPYATIDCQGAPTAFIIRQRQSANYRAPVGVILQNLRIINCGNTSVVANVEQISNQRKNTAVGSMAADLTAINCSFSGNKGVHGGAISNSGGHIILQSCSFKHNTAHCGGAVSSTTGTLHARNCLFDGNQAGGETASRACSTQVGSAGGAVFAVGSSLQLVGCRLIHNSAWGTAGCTVMVQAPTAATVVHSSQFSFNRCSKPDSKAGLDHSTGASSNGGKAWCSSGGASLAVVTSYSWFDKPLTKQSCAAVSDSAGAVLVLDSSFNSDVASKYATGGSACFAGTTLLMSNTSFQTTAAHSGGGLAAFGSLVLLAGASFVQLTAETGGAVFTDHSNVFLSKGTTFENCSAQSAAGGICVQDALVSLLEGVAFSSCSAYSSGGAMMFKLTDSIYNEPDVFAVTFINNVVVKSSVAEIGGAISTKQDDSVPSGAIDMYLDGCHIEGCQAVYSSTLDVGYTSALSISNSTFKNNRATWGVLWLDGPRAEITNCLWQNNTSEQQGGAIYIPPDLREHVTCTNCTFVDNFARISGGAVHNDGRNVSFDRCTFIRNRAGLAGGALAMSGSNELIVRATHTSFLNNTASQQGGAIHAQDWGLLNLQQCQFAGNSALMSGGTVSATSTRLMVTATKFERGTATFGGALLLDSGSAVISASAFWHQQASSGGAIAVLSGASVTLMNCTFGNNTAQQAGGEMVSVWVGIFSYCGVGGESSAIARWEGNLQRLRGAVVMYSLSRLTSQNTSFKGNVAGLGGAIAAEHAQLNVSASTFTSNKASGSQAIVTFIQQHPAGAGGAVHMMQTTLQAANSVFANNQADLQGGALQLVGGRFDGTALQLDGNAALEAGGGACVVDRAAGLSRLLQSSWTGFTCHRCQFSSNTARMGGGIYAASAAAAPAFNAPMSLTLSNVLFTSNAAVGSGGALSCRGPLHLSLVNSTLALNTAAAGTAGAVSCTLCQDVNVTASVFANNSAQACGALLLLQGAGHAVIDSSLFVQNAALSPVAAAVSERRIPAGVQVSDVRLESSWVSGAISSGRFGELVAYNDTGSGGAVCVSAPAAATTLRHCQLEGNSAKNGGGLFIQACQRADSCQRAKSAALFAMVRLFDFIIIMMQVFFVLQERQRRRRHADMLLLHSALSLQQQQRKFPSRMHRDPRHCSAFSMQQSLSMEQQPAAKPPGILQAGSSTPRQAEGLQTAPAGSSAVLQQLQDLSGLAGGAQEPPESGTGASGPGADPRGIQPSPSCQYPDLLSATEPEVSAAAAVADWQDRQEQQAWQEEWSQVSEDIVQLSPFFAQQLKDQPCGSHLHETAARLQQQQQQHQVQSLSYNGCGLISLDQLAAVKAGGVGSKLAPIPSDRSFVQPLEFADSDDLSPMNNFDSPFVAHLLSTPSTLCSVWAGTSELPQEQHGTGLTRAETVASCNGQQQQLQQQTAHGTPAGVAQGQSCEEAAATVSPFEEQEMGLALSSWDEGEGRGPRFVTRQSGISAPDGGSGRAQGPGLLRLGDPLLMAESDPSKQDELIVCPSRGARVGPGVLLEFLVEFLQLLSVLRLTKASSRWSADVAAVSSYMIFTPVSSLSWVSLDCALPVGYGPTGMAAANIILGLLLPMVYVGGACLIVFLKNVYRARRVGFKSLRRVLTLPSLRPELFATVVKALSYSYPSIAAATLLIFSCSRIDGPPRVPGEVVAAEGLFWTRAYDVKCFEDDLHRTLVLAAGIPALIILVLGFPLLQLAAVVHLRRKPDGGLANPASWADYGMLYQDYRPRMFAWGVMRELRKLLLVAVVVGLAAQPGSLQMLGAWLVMLMLLLSHAALCPFSSWQLNGLQVVLLGAVCITVLLNLVAYEAGVDHRTGFALDMAWLSMDGALVVALLLMFLWQAWLMLKSWLDDDGDGKVTWNDITATWSKHSSALSSYTSSRLDRLASTLLRSGSGRISPRGSTTTHAVSGMSPCGSTVNGNHHSGDV
eukprot:gene4934-5176_t